MSGLVHSLTRPRLRPLEAIPVDQDGGQRIVWRDPVGVAPTVEVPHPLAVLMTLLDGRRDLAAVRAEWLRRSGEDLPADFLTGLVAELDGYLLLDTPQYDAARQQALDTFRATGVRPTTHCPGAYPADAGECRTYLDRLLRQGRAAAGAADGPVRGLVAPHIDLTRGGVCYGAAYERLRSSTADLFVVLGVAHSSSCWPAPPPLQTLTQLDFATPLGPVTTDRAFVEDLAARYVAAGGRRDDLFRDELVHRDEHSLEFQMLWLRHIRGDRPFRVVPLLGGSLHAFYAQPGQVTSRQGYGPLVTALREALAAYDGEVCLVAGADLSHVGPRFGDSEPVGPARVKQVEAGDGAALAALGRDADAWFGHFAADANARNVCSVSNLWLLRALLPDAEFELLRYEVAVDPEQTVSFAAAVLR